MVRTRPENKLPKIADTYKPKSKPKSKARRKIAMEKEGSATPPVQEKDTGSPSALDAELIENLAASQPAPSLLDDAEEAATEELAKTPTPKKTSEEKEKTSSSPKTKKKRSSTSSSAKTPASPSRTVSSPKPSEGEPEKQTSAAGSSSDKASSDDEEEEIPPPPKKPKIEPRSSKRVKKAQAAKGKAKLKEERHQRELTVPKAIEWNLLKQLGIAEEVKRNHFIHP